MAKLDILYGSLIGFIAALFFYMTGAFPAKERGLDPRIFPRIVSGCTFLLSVVLIVKGIRTWHARKPDSQQKGARKLDREQVQRIFKLFVAGLVYVLIINWVGYLWVTPFFIAAAMVLFKEKSVLRIIIVSVVTTTILFFIFRIVFKVPLPTWSF